MANTQPIPRQLENPPRLTGNTQQDIVLILDWVFRAYQVIQQSVNFINQQAEEVGDFDVTDLPDPGQTTLAIAQTTANLAYALADQADDKADANEENIDDNAADIVAIQDALALNITDTFTLSNTNNGVTVTFGTAQPDANYTVYIQAIAFTGTPNDGAFTIIEKTYNAADFSATILDTPGSGNSVTYEWQLIRNP